MSGGITMSKALLNTKPRYPRKGKSGLVVEVQQPTMNKVIIPQLRNQTPMWIFDPPIFLTGKRAGAIELVKEYMKNQDERMKLLKLNAPLPEPIHNEHDELSYKMIKAGIFECSRQCTESFWKFVGEDEDDITLAEMMRQFT